MVLIRTMSQSNSVTYILRLRPWMVLYDFHFHFDYNLFYFPVV